MFVLEGEKKIAKNKSERKWVYTCGGGETPKLFFYFLPNITENNN